MLNEPCLTLLQLFSFVNNVLQVFPRRFSLLKLVLGYIKLVLLLLKLGDLLLEID